ncbi:MAG: ribonuclease R [Candidatus Binatia bacterium]
MPRTLAVPIEALLALLEQRAPRPLSIAEMARMLELGRYDSKRFKAALEARVASHTLRRIGKTRYQWIRERERRRTSVPPRTRADSRPRTPSQGVVEGRYSRVRAGYGFVEVAGDRATSIPHDILIPAGMQGAALHGDRTVVEILRRDRRTGRLVGRVVSVTGPAHERIIGSLERTRTGWLLVPQSDRLPPVEVVADRTLRRQDAGQVAVVRLTRAPTPARVPGGHLEQVLGAPDDPEVQFLSIAFEHGLRVEFPPTVLAEAERLPRDPPAHEFADRVDLRRLPFVTIDGETARDFDDAVCLEAQPGGSVRLRVAIADVSHYVRAGSALEDEAARRGTSVYFPDRAIPMLPARLSHHVCSLNPGCDRLVLVAEMRYDRQGRRRDARFYRSVIRSRARLTYTTVAAVLSAADTPEIRGWRGELGELLPQLRRMLALMRQLNRARREAGSLDLDLPEALIDLSDAGRSVGVRLLQRNDAHRLIEEFMLEANRAVATFLREHQVPLPYRIHEPPDRTDIEELNELLQAFGFFVDDKESVQPRQVQHLLRQIEGHRLARLLARLVLRSLKQARYTTRNAGHFGLAFPVYCHFTSPIRRYPDLLVHRQLSRLFDGEVDEARAAAETIEAACVQSSQREREAVDAERAMLDLKKAEFMLEHLLEPQRGTIVSVVSWGFFVELDAFPIEGLVRASDLRGDRYRFIEAEHALKGMRRGARFRLGDRVLVEATNVSLARREITFALLQGLAASG